MKVSASNAIEAYSIIKDKIITGQYRPSESLTEANLCADLGVSRTTIKKVLLMLEKENLVTIELNKSAKVKSFTLEEIFELLDVRILLESFIVRNAVEHITEKRLDEMAEILRDMKKCIEERRLLDYSKNNQIFHRLIYNACTNKKAVEIVANIKNQISRYDIKTVLIQNRDLSSFSEHTALYEAIRAKNADRAVEINTLHVTNIKNVLNEYHALLL